MAWERGADYARDYIVSHSQCEPNTGCWLWEMSTSQDGYGAARLRGFRERRAHRIAYVAFIEPIPPGFLVRHKCDVRICVNPAHLTLGTHADNMADMRARPRQGRVSAPGSAKSGRCLSPEQAAAIYQADGSSYQIGRAFGVGSSMVRRIRRDEAWTQVTAGLAKGELAHIPGRTEPQSPTTREGADR